MEAPRGYFFPFSRCRLFFPGFQQSRSLNDPSRGAGSLRNSCKNSLNTLEAKESIFRVFHKTVHILHSCSRKDGNSAILRLRGLFSESVLLYSSDFGIPCIVSILLRIEIVKPSPLREEKRSPNRCSPTFREIRSFVFIVLEKKRIDATDPATVLVA